MLEKQLIANIVKLLPKTIHSQSMTGSSMTYNGTPDRYFDGPKADLWVEFKMLKSMPRDRVVKGNFSALQLQWMERRYKNLPHAPNVVGIVGLPNRTAVLQLSPTEWRNGSPVETARTLREIATWVQNFTGH